MKNPTDNIDEQTFQEGRTELSAMGKFPLLDHLTSEHKPQRPSTVKGIGDDATVVGVGNTKTIVATHTMAEGVNFDMTYFPLRHLGYKAIATALNKVAAMNVVPTQVMLSISLSNRYSVEALDEFFAGVYLCIERYDVDLVGCDINSSRSGMVITATAIGAAEVEKIAYCSGAKVHDLVCVTGDLGSAYAGFLVLERERVTFQANPSAQPNLEGYDYVLERFLKPEPRVDLIKTLAESGVVPTAMTAVGDGLASDMIHICRASNCGCEVYEERVPIDYQTSRVCSEMNKNLLPLSTALNGGEDHEILFTIDQKDYPAIQTMPGVSIIGHITDEGSAPYLVTPQNTVIKLVAQGWQKVED